MASLQANSHQADIVKSVSATFSARFGSTPRIFRAPGRVNLIGEHTDYNDGFVLPAAIDLYTWTAIAPRSDRKIVVFSENFRELAEIDLATEDSRPKDHWIDYIHGVALLLQNSGIRVPGANLAIFSNVPLGSGLSSSAALEVSAARALLALSGHSLGLAEIAKLCQKAENEFVGARVGIMDQFASCFGSLNQAILLDCRSLEYQLLPLPPSIAMVICNTMVKHEHAGGEYNVRRAQCEQGVQVLKRRFPGIRTLRDISVGQLSAHRDDLPEPIYRRCHHVVSENERVLLMVEALKSGDLKSIGPCMHESHESLKNDYEVSCPELDTMVDLAAKTPGTIGARMTGGGFGGCTINLVNFDTVDNFRQEVAAGYTAATKIVPEIYVSTAGAGVTEINE